MPLALPINPNFDWLKKAAKKRLAALRATKPDAKLHQAQRVVANDYGFKSWRTLKAHLDAIRAVPHEHDRIFAAARAGDVEVVRRAFALGFDPATPDADGRTVHQIAKDLRHEAIELLARDVQGGRSARPEQEARAIQDIISAAQAGDVSALGACLDAHPELIDALGGSGYAKAAALHLATLRNQHAAMSF